MTQVIELYPPELKEVERSPSESGHEEFVRLAEKHNLRALSKAKNGLVPETRTWCRTQDMVPLTEDELAAWREYLPTSYWSNRSNALPSEIEVFDDQEPKTFSDYTFHEGVPLVVMRRLDTLAERFHVLEIRTPEVPERMMSDPVLWGHLILPDGSREIYPLARWAESDANFISGIDDLKKVLNARRGLFLGPVGGWGDQLFALCVCPLGFGILAAAVTGLLSNVIAWMPYGWNALYAGAIIGLILSATGVVSKQLRMRSLKKTNPQLLRFV